MSRSFVQNPNCTASVASAFRTSFHYLHVISPKGSGRYVARNSRGHGAANKLKQNTSASAETGVPLPPIGPDSDARSECKVQLDATDFIPC
jgi:hypothetical protein